jgi:DNA-binding MurR/RpiR family transcriptional regulator
MTVSQLAGQCGSAPSAVIRFCKSVQVGGFSNLKLALAAELGSTQQKTQLPAFTEGDGTENVVRKVFCSGIQTLNDTLELLDYETIGAMADSLAQAKRIFVFGIGTSSVIAADAQYRLSQMGIWATACTDILLMNVTASNLQQGDVVLAISHSGRTRAVVDAVRRAKACGAKVLAITSFSDSPLYRESDLASFVYADEANYPVEAVSARVAHTCLIDALAMVIATRDFETYADHIKARNIILDEIRY